LRRACGAPASAGDVLELACGTGLWTQRLAPHAASLTAIDGSPEMLERCRARVNDPGVRYVTADLRGERASAADHTLPARGQETMRRRLADGREHQIVKLFHEPEPLQRVLADLAWRAHVQTTPEFFIYGHAALDI
jgi:SAM-dependent methyltransferase